MHSQLRTFNKEPFNSNALKHVKGSFLKSYFGAVTQYHNFPAVSFVSESGIQTKTYGEFHSDVCLVAGLMTAQLDKDAEVVLISNNSYPLTLYAVAALLTGHTLIPISADEPVLRIKEKLRQLGDRVAVFYDSEKLEFDIQSQACNKIRFPCDKVGEATWVDSFSRPIIKIFTSGSTGYSKVVQQQEEGLLTNISALIELHKLKPGVNLVTPLSLSHVNALEFSFFSCLFSGAHVVLFERFDFWMLADVFQKVRVDILSVIPPIIRNLIEGQKYLKQEAMTSLRYVVSAATYLPQELARQWLKTFGTPVVQGYGLSEAINFSCLLPPDLSLEKNTYWLSQFEVPSVGPAIFGNEVFVVKDGNLAQEGEIGEICIRGWNVMFGYLNDDGAQVFEGGYLHTGDLGFYRICPWSSLPYFFITGRIKDIIKRNGVTVSLAEVEAKVIELLDSGEDCIAVGFKNHVAGEELALILQSHKQIDAPELKLLYERLKEILPSEGLPRVFGLTKRQIRTLSGKPQRWIFLPDLKKYEQTIFGPKFLLEYL